MLLFDFPDSKILWGFPEICDSQVLPVHLNPLACNSLLILHTSASAVKCDFD